MPRLEADIVDGGDQATPVDNSPRNSFADQLAALTPEAVANVVPPPAMTDTQMERQLAQQSNPVPPAMTDTQMERQLAQQSKPVPPAIVEPKLSTNQKIAKTIADYVAANPAPAGTHYGTTLDASGKPILYTNVSTSGGGFASGGGSSGGSGSGSGSSGSTGAGGANLTLVSTGTDPVTNATIGYFSDGSQKILTPGGVSQVQSDAYALLEDAFKNYGLDSLVPVIEGYMKANLGSQQAALQLKQTQQYKDRFAGNQARLSAGMNALSESEYLALENSYNTTLEAYGLSGFFGTDRASQVAGLAKVIGSGVSATEFTDRVSTVVDRVMNADPNIKKTIQQFYNLTDADLVKYYLDPSKDSLAALKLKTTAAEIGTAATEQGLTTGVTSATALAQAGVTQAQAQKGYTTIAEVLPEAQKLSSIYGEAKIGYNQATAESEVFNTAGGASAARKRKQLADLETQAFQGKSGINQQANPLGKGLQGSF